MAESQRREVCRVLGLVALQRPGLLGGGAVVSMEAPALEAMTNGIDEETESDQLLPRDHAMLAANQSPEPLSLRVLKGYRAYSPVKASELPIRPLHRALPGDVRGG